MPATRPEDIWTGASLKNQHVLIRTDDLRQVPATLQYTSCEQLLGPLDDLNLGSIARVIGGDESGQGAWRRKFE